MHPLCATYFNLVCCWLTSGDVTAGLNYVPCTEEYILPCNSDHVYCISAVADRKVLKN
jgi:hypothetical protein